MQYRREWRLPPPLRFYAEEFEQVEHWGKSYFWYCHKCGDTYASARLTSSDGRLAPFKALGGLCPRCPSNKWSLAGSIEAFDFVGWPVDKVVLDYQLQVELKFLDHPEHPYNKEQSIA